MIEEGPVMLDYNKVKHDMAFAADRRKCLLLQSLRWVSYSQCKERNPYFLLLGEKGKR